MKEQPNKETSTRRGHHTEGTTNGGNTIQRRYTRGGVICCTPFVDIAHLWIMLPHPWIKWFPMDEHKCSLGPCIRLVE